MTDEETVLKSSGWTEIASKDGWNAVDARINGGEDGLLKDFHLSHKNFVNSDLQMFFQGRPRAWMLLQLQNVTTPSIEFFPVDVERMQMDSNHDLAVNMAFDGSARSLWLSLTGESQVTARRVFYRIPSSPLLGDVHFNLMDD